MIRFFGRLGVTALAFVPIAASAHIGVGDPHGFAHGFSHPLSGVDHILAMIAVGLFAAHLGGRALWLVPSSFVSVMTLASIAGMPESSSSLLYGIGFVCATALLHATGVGLGIAIGKSRPLYSHRITRVGGVAMAIAGVALVISP